MEANAQDHLVVFGENYRDAVFSVETNAENIKNEVYVIDQFLDVFETETNTLTEEGNGNSISANDDDKSLLDSQFSLPFHGSGVFMGMIPPYDFQEELKTPYVPSSKMNEKLIDVRREVDDRVDFDGDRKNKDVQVEAQHPDQIEDGKYQSLRGDKGAINSNNRNLLLCDHGDNGDKSSILLSCPTHGSETFIGGLPHFVMEDDMGDFCEPAGQVFEKPSDVVQEDEERVDFYMDICIDNMNYYTEVQPAIGEDNKTLDVIVETKLENPEHFEGRKNQLLGGGESELNSISMTDNENYVLSVHDDNNDEQSQLLSHLPDGSEISIGGLPQFVLEEEMGDFCNPAGHLFEKPMNEEQEPEERVDFDGDVCSDDVNYYTQDHPATGEQYEDGDVLVDRQMGNSDPDEGGKYQLLGINESLLNSISVADDGNSVPCSHDDNSDKQSQLLPRPPHGSDIFIDRITPIVLEDESENFCETAGQVYEKSMNEGQEGEEIVDFDGEVCSYDVDYYTQDHPATAEEYKDGGVQVDRKIRNSEHDECGKDQLLGINESELSSISVSNNGNSVPCGHDANSDKQSQLLSRPPHGSEIFIGGLPRFVLEDELEDFCGTAGNVYEVNITVNKDSGECKGYAFVSFTSREDALRAVEELHNKEFKGKIIRCSLHESKYRLFIKNIPKTWTDDDFRRAVEEVGPGVTNIDLIKEPLDPTCNRGFAFVEYYNSSCADYSREKMTITSFNFDGNVPNISWADTRCTVDNSATSQVKALYVKNIPRSAGIEELRELFERHGEVTSVILPNSRSPHPKGDFGFINFAERSGALRAIKDRAGYVIRGEKLGVSLAKPQSEKRYEGSGGAHGSLSCGYQQVIHGSGAVPGFMNMVPVTLPDGRIGYVLQQAPEGSPPRRTRRRDRSWSRSRSRSRELVRRRRYRDEEDDFDHHGRHRRHRHY